tara:strand:- start:18659 stop:19624 length:966 start_codon:yes stop_codon:yes gene_type:complete
MKKLLLSAFVFLNFYNTEAQIEDTPLNVDLPTASSITKYEQVPVNLSTGTVNISIPLCTIQENGISLPISLSYESTGVKPNQKPSWVGTNWSLNAGGVITRVVNYAVDELYSSINGGGNPTEIPYIDHYSLLNVSNWIDLVDSYSTIPDFSIDLNPDEFYFNMNGYSGSFFLNHLGEWEAKSSINSKLIIEAQTSAGLGFNLPEKFYSVTGTQNHNLTRTYVGFKITTPDGVQYTFGYDPNAIEFTNSRPDINQYNEQYVSKSWFLTEITHPNGVEFDLEYERKLEAVFTASKYFQARFGAVQSLRLFYAHPSLIRECAGI